MSTANKEDVYFVIHSSFLQWLNDFYGLELEDGDIFQHQRIIVQDELPKL